MPEVPIITADEVNTAVHSLKNNKALGKSWITAELLKHHKCDEIYTAIATIFNRAN